MSDSEKPSGEWGRQGAPPGTKTQEQWWRRALNPDRLQAFWKRMRGPGASGAMSRRRAAPGRFRTESWMLAIWIVLLCLPIGGVILGYVRRPAPGTAGITSSSSPGGGLSDSGDKIPKPPPGRPMLQASQAPPPTVTTSPSPAAISPETPPSIATPQTPLPPASTPAPPAPAPGMPPSPSNARMPFAAVTYPARHDKHFGDECMGQLTLNSSGLYFTCPSNAGEGVQAAVNQIDAVDDNGIRLLSGKKYHFTIPGMSKNGERQVFADWLNHVR